MTVNDAVKLVAVMVGLYLFDSTLLLYANEAIISPARKKWRVRFGTDNFSIAGRAVFLPNLLLVHRPLFRLAWYRDQGGQQPSQDLPALAERLLKLAPFVYASALAQFALLPFVLFFSFNTQNLLIAGASIYACVGLAIAAIVLEKDHFGLTGKQLGSLAAECLLCPPIAINLIRRISLSHAVDDDLSVIAKALLDEGGWDTLSRQMAAQSDDLPASRDGVDHR